jgi:hypothetical protein
LTNPVATPSGDGGAELDHRIEAIVAAVAPPKVPDFIAAEAFREFRIFRRHHQFAAFGTGRPPEVAFMTETHRHSDLKRHDESLRARMEPC